MAVVRRRKISKLQNLRRYVRAYQGPGPGQLRPPGSTGPDPIPELPEVRVSSDLEANLAVLQQVMGANTDFVIRRFQLRVAKRAAAIVYLENNVDQLALEESILRPLVFAKASVADDEPEADILGRVRREALAAPEVSERTDLGGLLQAVASGYLGLLVEGAARALVIDLNKFEGRPVGPPETEGSVRGPRDGFIENINANVAMLRQKLRSPHLIFERLTVGRVSVTPVVIGYVRGLAAPALVREVKARVGRIDIDGVLDSGHIEELTKDDPFSIFPLVLSTERPDRAAAGLMEGRVVIIVDGSPFVLVAPVDLLAVVHSPEDYYMGFPMGTMIRLIRYLAVFVAILLPAIYIAITTYHQEMLPTEILVAIISAREGVPFPVLIEALIMEFMFEALREAGVRLPRPFGQAISIVGALIMGSAAVQAGLVSPIMVIIVAITAIASFISPIFSMALAVRFLRFPAMLLGAALGLYGVALMLFFLLIHMAGLRSLGMPFLSPIAPHNLKDMKDTFVRAPWHLMEKRPGQLFKTGRRRLAPGLKPEPPPERY
jgi:spore germination protein KA